MEFKKKHCLNTNANIQTSAVELKYEFTYIVKWQQ